MNTNLRKKQLVTETDGKPVTDGRRIVTETLFRGSKRVVLQVLSKRIHGANGIFTLHEDP